MGPCDRKIYHDLSTNLVIDWLIDLMDGLVD